MVGKEGIEPSRPCGQGILSPSRLPVPPLSHFVYKNIPYFKKFCNYITYINPSYFKSSITLSDFNNFFKRIIKSFLLCTQSCDIFKNIYYQISNSINKNCFLIAENIFKLLFYNYISPYTILLNISIYMT